VHERFERFNTKQKYRGLGETEGDGMERRDGEHKKNQVAVFSETRTCSWGWKKEHFPCGGPLLSFGEERERGRERER
jgi:hypothetical protein